MDEYFRTMPLEAQRRVAAVSHAYCNQDGASGSRATNRAVSVSGIQTREASSQQVQLYQQPMLRQEIEQDDEQHGHRICRTQPQPTPKSASLVISTPIPAATLPAITQVDVSPIAGTSRQHRTFGGNTATQRKGSDEDTTTSSHSDVAVAGDNASHLPMPAACTQTVAAEGHNCDLHHRLPHPQLPAKSLMRAPNRVPQMHQCQHPPQPTPDHTCMHSLPPSERTDNADTSTIHSESEGGAAPAPIKTTPTPGLGLAAPLLPGSTLASPAAAAGLLAPPTPLVPVSPQASAPPPPAPSLVSSSAVPFYRGLVRVMMVMGIKTSTGFVHLSVILNTSHSLMIIRHSKAKAGGHDENDDHSCGLFSLSSHIERL